MIIEFIDGVSVMWSARKNHSYWLVLIEIYGNIQMINNSVFDLLTLPDTESSQSDRKFDLKLDDSKLSWRKVPS